MNNNMSNHEDIVYTIKHKDIVVANDLLFSPERKVIVEVTLNGTNVEVEATVNHFTLEDNRIVARCTTLVNDMMVDFNAKLEDCKII